MLDQDEKGRLTPFVRILVENALAENADFGRITPTIEELVKKTIEDGRASAQREIKVEFWSVKMRSSKFSRKR